MIHFDTSFLIDVLRERRRDIRGPATTFLTTLPDDEPAGISVHAVCELFVGAALAQDPDAEHRGIRRLLSTLAIATPDDEQFPSTYARALTQTQQAGTPIATMDLLIATAAVCASAPLVTGNVKHFAVIPGLDVRTHLTSTS